MILIGQNSPKLNSRLVYCSRLYGSHTNVAFHAIYIFSENSPNFTCNINGQYLCFLVSYDSSKVPTLFTFVEERSINNFLFSNYYSLVQIKVSSPSMNITFNSEFRVISTVALLHSLMKTVLKYFPLAVTYASSSGNKIFSL